MRAFMKTFSGRLVLCAALVGMMQTPLWADDNEADPGLGVARVSLTNGDVTLQRGDSDDWIEARVNTPLVAGDTVAVGPSSRAEVQLDHSNFLRLGANTEIFLAELENKSFKIEVTRGLVTYAELRGGEANVDIETADVIVRPAKNGSYRVQVLESGETEITVRTGQAEVISRQGSELLKQGHSMLVRANPADGSLEFQVAKASAKDDWDQWNEQRDDELKQSASYARVGPGIYGVADLDPYGRWVYVSGYGDCWAPYVGAAWAPYRYGRWVWLDYYGWTWVSYEPWGWAPYHYGRWFHNAGFGWVWYPGRRHVRHYWRPALVAFFGYGSHSGFNFGVGFGFGQIGWIPLGPRDPYYPWYGRGRRRAAINININIYNVYQNARVRGGITAVGARDFSRGHVGNIRPFRQADLRNARLIHGELPVVPQREALGRAARHASQGEWRLQAARQATRSARQNRNQARRIPFEQQQERVAARLRAGSTAARNAGPSSTREESRRRRVQEDSSGAWRVLGQNSLSGRSRTESGMVNSFQGTAPQNWRRFQPGETSQERERRFSGATSPASRATSRQEERGRSPRPNFSPSDSRRPREDSNGTRGVGRARTHAPTPSARPTREAPRPQPRAESGQRQGASRTAGRSAGRNNRGQSSSRGKTEARPRAHTERTRP
jgi:hypothetical protein